MLVIAVIVNVGGGLLVVGRGSGDRVGSVVIGVHLVDTVELVGGSARGAVDLFIIRLTLNLLLFRVIMLETTWLECTAAC